MKKTAAEAEQLLPQSKAREKLLSLFDENSFAELGKYASKDGKSTAVICGYGTVNGQKAYAYAQDSEINGGAMTLSAAKKLTRLYELAGKNGVPVVGIFDSKGADISEGMKVLDAYSQIASASAALSGVVPQIAVIDGVCAGSAAMTACMADIVIMTKRSEMFMTAPFLADDAADAGKAESAMRAGMASVIAEDTEDALEKVGILLGLLPANNLSCAYFDCDDADNGAQVTAQMKGMELVEAVADSNSTAELCKGFGDSAVTALGSVAGHTVGFIAADGGERLSRNDSAKIARFVGFCDAFSVPMITFINTEGFALSGCDELAGAVRDNAKLTQIYSSATAAKINVITGKAYGSAYVAFSDSDVTVAWDSATIAPAAPEAAVTFLQGAAAPEETAQRVALYEENDASPFTAAADGYVDSVIAPEDTRRTLAEIVEMLSDKRAPSPARKHINFVY